VSNFFRLQAHGTWLFAVAAAAIQVRRLWFVFHSHFMMRLWLVVLCSRAHDIYMYQRLQCLLPVCLPCGLITLHIGYPFTSNEGVRRNGTDDGHLSFTIPLSHSICAR